MAGLLLLILSFWLGSWLTRKFLPFLKKTPFFLPVSFFIGIWASGTVIFLLASLLHDVSDPLGMAVIVFLGLSVVFLWRWRIKLPQPAVGQIAFWLLFFLFSWWFFGRTFAYQNGQILVASNQYLDFGAHVPLIRSFSRGNNFPPKMPFYSGQPIFYHFLFDFTTAVFEKAGWSIAASYNLLSALSLSSLLVMIYYFSQKIFGVISRLLGFLAVMLFVFTPDLSFLFFPRQDSIGGWLTTLRNHNFYLNNGLTVDRFFGGFFNINVFTNQRHLVFGLGLFLIFILLLDRLRRRRVMNKVIIFSGVLLGLLPFWHNFVFLAVVLVFSVALVAWDRRVTLFKILLVAGLVALPQIFFIQQYTQNQILFRPGFLMHDDLTFFNWLRFWVYNFGFGLVAMIGGWLIASKRVRRFLTPMVVLFIIPNIFSFAKEPFNDHKFFVAFSLFGAMLIAWFITWLWRRRGRVKLLAPVLFVLLVASGLLNLLVVKNDVWVSFADTPADVFLQWVEENTAPRDVFLTNLGIWDQVNFTGRKKFLGRSHYLFAYGTNPSDRQREKAAVLAGQDPGHIHGILADHSIDFFAFSAEGENYNRSFFEDNFSSVYQNPPWTIYAAK